MIIDKRIVRELNNNKFRYGTLFFLIVLCISVVVSLAGAADSVFDTVDRNKQINRIEDGEFIVTAPYTQEQQAAIERLGVSLAENFYVEKKAESGTILRIFKNRRAINTFKPDSGELPEANNQIAIDKMWSRNYHLRVNDTLTIGSSSYSITGIGSVPDYSLVLQSPFDVVADPDKFSIAFVSEETFNKMSGDKGSITYNYAYSLNGGITAAQLKTYIKENLIYFLEAKDNPRIDGVKEDSQINKSSALIAGIIVMLLLAYMISIFISHNIEKESPVIGALYALGYRKKNLLRHYMILPCILVFVASVAGVILGYYLIPFLEDTSTYYSLPEIQPVLRLYLVSYGLGIPLVVTWIVNYIVINGKLSSPPLQLLRSEKKRSPITNLNLGNLGFIHRFRIRQFIREIKGNITIIIGLMLAILLMIFSFGIKGTIDNYVTHATEDASYNYMYTLKLPLEETPLHSEQAFIKPMKSYLDIAGKELEVNLFGIRAGNPFFKFSIEQDRDGVFISNAVAYKYGLDTGDTMKLEDPVEDISYTFRVAGVVPFSAGLYIFMDLNNMQNVFGESEDYYNTLLSTVAMDIAPGAVDSVITLEDMAKSASRFNEIMRGLITLLLTVSIIIFILVLYLLLKMMIDKATPSIALINVFGYNRREVKKLYLGNTLYTVILAAAVGIPISTWIVRMIWPYMISNVAAGFESVIPIKLYAVTVGIILLSYLFVQYMLARHIKQIRLVEILRNRE